MADPNITDTNIQNKDKTTMQNEQAKSGQPGIDKNQNEKSAIGGSSQNPTGEKKNEELNQSNLNKDSVNQR